MSDESLKIRDDLRKRSLSCRLNFLGLFNHKFNSKIDYNKQSTINPKLERPYLIDSIGSKTKSNITTVVSGLDC